VGLGFNFLFYTTLFPYVRLSINGRIYLDLTNYAIGTGREHLLLKHRAVSASHLDLDADCGQHWRNLF
jgi:hypothetical protein